MAPTRRASSLLTVEAQHRTCWSQRVTILVPDISVGPCEDTPGPCYFAHVTSRDPLSSDKSPSRAYKSLAAALVELQRKLVERLRPGDQIFWEGYRYDSVDAAMRVIQKNPLGPRPPTA